MKYAGCGNFFIKKKHMKTIYVDSVTGESTMPLNPRIAEELTKGHVEHAFRETGLTVKKPGKEIIAALNRIKEGYQEKMVGMTAEFGVVAKKMTDCGLGTPEFPKYDDGGRECVNRFNPEIKWGDMSSEQARCMEEYGDLTWKIRLAKEDIAATNNLLAMIEDGKSYPLNVNQHMALFG
jgi:hypothetical protein